MSLSPGDRLGPYEILAPIGEGGMGAVWKARDTRLNRTVAVKVSREKYSDRFEREARAVAALNHHHICTLHDVGPNYLVMEFVEGTPLKGPLPMEKALEYAGQVCDALDAAHRKGVTHRDLKPGNVLVTRHGIKLLDFGLAKVAGDETLTVTGAVMGTPAYMAPEQWAGQPGDVRSDIYALGCMLYEMLLGKRAAQERNPVEPAALEKVIGRCLAKDPEERWQSARDVKAGLELVALGQALAPAKVRPGRPWGWMAAGALAIVAAGAQWAPWHGHVPIREQRAMEVDFTLAPAATNDFIGSDAVLSPDGTRIVFVAQATNGESQLLTRLIKDSRSVELSGSEGAWSPFFSPDGQWVAFFVHGKLKKTRVDGGQPIVLCEAPAGRGGSWGEDNNIVAALDSNVGLVRVSADGGLPSQLTTLLPGENSHRWPQVLPGGRMVLFTSNRHYAYFEAADINVLTRVGGKWTRTIVAGVSGMYPRYLPSGHLTYLTKGTLFAVPFDLKRLKVDGPSVKLVEEVSNDMTFGSARIDFSASANGMSLYRKGRTEGLRTIHWLDTTGNPKPLTTFAAAYQCIRISPDGGKLAWMACQGSSADIWILDLQRGGNPTRLTDGKDVYSNPVWSPDGQYVVFNSVKGIWWTRADGAGTPQPLTTGKSLQFPTTFTTNGATLVFSEEEREGGTIWTVPVEANAGQLRAGSPKPFLSTKMRLNFPAISPDGHWLAYADAKSGIYEVYVREFPDTGYERPISNNGGTMPLWSPNGSDLFYRTEDSQIMVVTYKAKPNLFETEPPRLWSDKRLANTGLTPNFDLEPTGNRFAVLMPAEWQEPPEPERHLKLMMNFFDEVSRRVSESK